MVMTNIGKTLRTVTATAAVIATAAIPGAEASTDFEYLGQWRLPHGMTIDGTVVGGLSGISYSPDRDLFYTISDDKSEHGPVRFYGVQLKLSDNGIEDGQIVGTHLLLDETGRPFRPGEVAPGKPGLSPDAEGIAVDGPRQRLYWTSEGSIVDSTDGRWGDVLQPWIRIAGLDGKHQGEIPLPAGSTFSMDRTGGPKPNGVLEGLSLTPDGRFLFTAMEQPLYQDGPNADEDRAALIRITKFDVESNKLVAQYAYQVERAAPRTGLNGVSDILALSESSLLIVERAANLPEAVAVKVYRADVGPATDVAATPSLDGLAVTPMAKSMAIDLNANREIVPLDNIEGITLGPVLPDGRQSVVLVSDDNFQPFEVTQFLAFAL